MRLTRFFLASALSSVFLFGCSQSEEPQPAVDNGAKKAAPANDTVKATATTTAGKRLAYLSSPAVNSSHSDALSISGVAMFHSSGIAKVEVYVDGEIAGSAKTHLPKEKLSEKEKSVNDPDAPNVKFEMTLDISKLSKGKHELSIRATSRDKKTLNFGKRDFTVK